jgi:hypothetical protein
MQEEVYKELWDRDKRVSINNIEVNPDKVFKIQEGLQIKGQKIPDPKLHQRISFIKSAIRLGACAFGFFGMFEVGFIGLFLAEIVGIGEELV